MSKIKKLGIDPLAKSNLSWIQDTREENDSPGVKLSPIEFINPRKLKINPLNTQFFDKQSTEEYDALKADVKVRGIIVPLIAKRDFTLVTGETRLNIAADLNLSTVPVQFIEENLSEQEERDFLVKDNLRRRQLTAEQKETLIRKLYPEEIQSDKRGGDRKSKTKIKSSVEPLISLPNKIEKDTGIPAGTAKRILAKIRKEKVTNNLPHKSSEIEIIRKDLKKIVRKVKQFSDNKLLEDFLKEIEIIKSEVKEFLK